jgi:hypothetical protein
MRGREGLDGLEGQEWQERRTVAKRLTQMVACAG